LAAFTVDELIECAAEAAYLCTRITLGTYTDRSLSPSLDLGAHATEARTYHARDRSILYGASFQSWISAAGPGHSAVSRVSQ
jgi:hypothetical protein